MVKNITDYGAFVDLGGIDGLLHVTDLSYKRVNHPNEMINIGDTVRARVKNISTEERRIGLSLRDVDGDAAGAVTRTEPGEALGDFGSALSDAISASKEEEAAPAEPAPAEAEKAPEA